MDDRFAEAPYIHPYNVPKYMAAALRSQNFARSVKRPVLWVMARDTPVTDADKSLKGEALHRARERWWQLHDQKTSGVPGIFPLVQGLPVQFTTTYARADHIFKFTRCRLWGWELQPLDEQRLAGCTEPEIVCCRGSYAGSGWR